jgi:predicted amidohydrolase
MSLKISFIQTELYWEQIDKNLEMLEVKIDAIHQETDLIVLPEMFSTGFSMNSDAFAEDLQNSQSIKWMQKHAEARDACVLGSLMIRDDGKHFNRMVIAFPDGQLLFYDKRHRFTFAGEDQFYSAGEKKLIFEYKGWRICPMICYDLRFPVWIRNKHEYDLLIFVANWPEARVKAWDTLLAARAIENMSYCLGVNRVGIDGKDRNHVGHSCLYDPLGEAVTAENFEGEKTTTVQLELSKLQEIREKMAFLDDQDDFTITP